MNSWRNVSSLAFLITLLLTAPTPAPGAVVQSCDEAGLRAALAAGGPAKFGCDGTIVLTNPIVVTTDLTLEADGHDVRLSGDGKVRLFEVSANGSLRLSGLTLREGFIRGTDGAPAGEGRGGAILVDQGELHASDCRFETNSAVGGNGQQEIVFAAGGAARGGAIFAAQSMLRLTNCSFVLNTVRGGWSGSFAIGGEAGGAAIGALNSDVIVADCQFAGNQAESGPGEAGAGVTRGGAWQQIGGTSRFTGGSFRTNIAAGYAGGIFGSSARGDALGGAWSLEAGSSVLEDVILEANQAVGRTNLSHFAPTAFGAGGAVFNQGNVQLRRCTLRGNASLSGRFEHGGQGASGGAIQNLGELLLRDCLVESNSTIGGSAGHGSFGTVFDPAVGSGGGLWNGGTANLLNSTFHGNRAVGGEGEQDVDGTAVPVGGWHAYGGGIFNTGTLTSANLTMAGNIAHGGYIPHITGGNPAPGGNAFGGGFFQGGGSIILTNSTIAYNAAVGGMGLPPGASFGDNFNISNGMVLLRNCIVAGTVGGSNCVGVISDGGHNISSDSTCQFSAAGSLNDTDPKLAPLADYGGPTPTIALLPGSPALDIPPMPMPAHPPISAGAPVHSAPAATSEPLNPLRLIRWSVAFRVSLNPPGTSGFRPGRSRRCLDQAAIISCTVSPQARTWSAPPRQLESLSKAIGW